MAIAGGVGADGVGAGRLEADRLEAGELGVGGAGVSGAAGVGVGDGVAGGMVRLAAGLPEMGLREACEVFAAEVCAAVADAGAGTGAGTGAGAGAGAVAGAGADAGADAWPEADAGRATASARLGARWLEAATGVAILLMVEVPPGAGAVGVAGFAAELAGTAALRSMAAKGLGPGDGETACLLAGAEAALAGGMAASAAASACDQAAGAAMVEGAADG